MSLITLIPKQSVFKRHVNILNAIIMFDCNHCPICHNALLLVLNCPALFWFYYMLQPSAQTSLNQRWLTSRVLFNVVHPTNLGDNESLSPLTSSTTASFPGKETYKPLTRFPPIAVFLRETRCDGFFARFVSPLPCRDTVS